MRGREDGEGGEGREREGGRREERGRKKEPVFPGMDLSIIQMAAS